MEMRSENEHSLRNDTKVRSVCGFPPCGHVPLNFPTFFQGFVLAWGVGRLRGFQQGSAGMGSSGSKLE